MRSHPFLFLTIAIILGKVCLDFAPRNFILLLVLIFALLISTSTKIKTSHGLILLSFFLLGMGLSHRLDKVRQRKMQTFQRLWQSGTPLRYLIKDIHQKTTSTHLVGKELVSGHPLFINVKLAITPTFSIGDTLTTWISSVRIEPPSNPFEFDYKKWAANHGIHFQVWLNDRADFTLDKTREGNMYKWSQEWAKSLSNAVDSIIKSPTTRGLVKGVLLGDKSEIDGLEVQLFKDSGTLHIMAVSGLHVGLIASILYFLLGRHQWYPLRLARTIFMFVGIWLFIAITGFRPSALRAGIMLCTFLVGTVTTRQTQGLNTLSLSCFLMIMAQPDLIYDLGFQFSVSAVLSILLFFPFIEQLINVTHKGLRGLWKLLALNLSVQLILGPVSIYYFHQFPTYFILSNLWAVPCVSIVLVLTLCALITYTIWNGAGVFLGRVIEKLSELFMWGLSSIMDLPFSQSTDIWFSAWTLWTWLTGIGLLAFFVRHKVQNFKRLSVTFLLLAVFLWIQEASQWRHTPMMIRYAGKWKARIDLYTGNDLLILQPEHIPLSITAIQSRKGYGKNYSVIRYKKQIPAIELCGGTIDTVFHLSDKGPSQAQIWEFNKKNTRYER